MHKTQFFNKFVLLTISLLSYVPTASAAPEFYGNSISAYIKPSDPVDEAMASYLRQDMSLDQVKTLFRGADEDYFKDMDKGVTAPENGAQLFKKMSVFMPNSSEQEIRTSLAIGRNNWMVWTGGNDKFWTHLGTTQVGGGQLDFLKTLSNHPQATSVRSKRWEELGLINEPCFEENLGPREDRWGLWLDQRSEDCQPDPFENNEKYPGIKIGSRGKTLNYKGQPVKHESSFYGFATGVVGLRIFPNPEFDEKAARHWDADKYYTSPEYYNDPKLIKPYRVGMACAFCHVGPEVSNLPKNFNAPKWENLSSTVGAQYFWVDRIFFWNYKKNSSNFVHQLLHTARPGALDTSLISSDQINNPRTMNAIYSFPARVKAARQFQHNETLVSTNRENRQFEHFLGRGVSEDSPVLGLAHSDRGLFLSPDRRREIPYRTAGTMSVTTPRILKDAADSAGILASLNRVYVNIGLFSEEWMKHFVPLLGSSPLKKITPFEIQVAESNSLYWRATSEQTPHLANFFLAAGEPDKLEGVEGGQQYMSASEEKLSLGKKVFANHCMGCHSSKLPEEAYSFVNQPHCQGPGYLKCWNNYWDYVSKNSDYKKKAQTLVQSDNFLEDNYLSTDLRVPVSLLGVQTCSSEATNGIKGNIWDHYTSDSYKELPSVQGVDIVTIDSNGNFVSRKRDLPGGGRGFIRPPSLTSLWSTAPFLSNNSIGQFDYRGTVEGRLQSFESSIEGLLNPDKRGSTNLKDTSIKTVSYSVNGKTAKGIVDVFSKDTYVRIPRNFIPKIPFVKLKSKFPFITKSDLELYKLIPKKLKLKDSSDEILMNGDLKSMAGSQIKSIEQFGADKNVYGSSYGDYSAEDYSTDNEDVQGTVGDNVVLGPFPKGYPVNLVANINMRAGKRDLISAVFSLVKGFKKIKSITNEKEALRVFTQITADKLLKVSKCPDLVVNKGHYFGTKYMNAQSKGLSSKEQEALIEYLKTL